ncbi:MAG: hypothetical protein WA364_30730 [Candidatus Nitrosopolaris sp.]
MGAKSILTLAMVLSIVTILIPHITYADNQGSYEYGWQQGSLKGGGGCAVNFTPKMCAETNAVIVAGFIGMILSFFTALFGASLVISSVLAKMLGKVRRIKVEKD